MLIASFLTLFKDIMAPVLDLAKLITDRTLLVIILPRGDGASVEDAHITDQGQRGLFYFGLTTKSSQPVEVESISVTYDSPLTLRDPEQRGFFQSAVSTSKNHPFALVWKGNITLTREIVVPFAVEAVFPSPLAASKIQLKVTGKRHAKFLSFTLPGRTHNVIQDVTLRLLQSKPMGLCIAKGVSSRPLQPYLKTADFNLVGSSPVRVDYTDSAGMSKSVIYHQPK